MKVKKQTLIIAAVILIIVVVVFIYFKIRKKNAEVNKSQPIETNSDDKIVGKKAFALKDKEAVLLSQPNLESDVVGTIKPTKNVGIVKDLVVGDKDEKIYYVFTVTKNGENTDVFVREDNIELK